MNFIKRWFESVAGKASGDPVRDDLARAASKINAGQEDEALGLFTTIIEADPENGEAHLGLGMLRLRAFAAEPAVSTLHDAVTNLSQAAALLPHSAEAYFYLAFAESFTLDTVNEAETHLQRAMALDPGLTERAVEIQERITAARTGMQEQAIDPATLRAAVQHYEYGQTLIEKERYGEALAAFDDAITLYPAYAEALLASGETYRKLNRIADAIAALRRALAVRPHMVEAHLSLGSLYLQQGDRQRALEQLSLALAQSPDQPQMLRNVGLLQLATSQPDAAMSTFRRLCAVAPDDPEPRVHLALAALQSGDQAAAREALSRVEGAALNQKQHGLATEIYQQLGDVLGAERHRAAE